jgi:hypothetical protein
MDCQQVVTLCAGRCLRGEGVLAWIGRQTAGNKKPAKTAGQSFPACSVFRVYLSFRLPPHGEHSHCLDNEVRILMQGVELLLNARRHVGRAALVNPDTYFFDGSSKSIDILVQAQE